MRQHIENLILIGGGGHCKACIDVIEAENRFEIKGILDVEDKIGQQLLGYPFIGTDQDIKRLVEEGYSFVITMGQIKTARKRKALYEQLKKLNAKLPIIVSPAARISKHAVVGDGTVVLHGVHINADATIGENCILNTNCTIEHDVSVGSHVHVSTNAVINGNCLIGDEAFIGSNTVIANNIRVASQVLVGSGSSVIKDIHEPGTFVGNPVRKI